MARRRQRTRKNRRLQKNQQVAVKSNGGMGSRIVANLQEAESMVGAREEGTSGIEATAGFITMAYNSELYWPQVYPLYNRIRRSDPEVTLVRNMFTTLAKSVDILWETPDNPTDDDLAAAKFAEEATNDITGGIGQFIEMMVSYAPFMGWAWWEALPGLRSETWTAPGDDPWKSQYNDGLVGFRRLAFRDHSSFYQWDMDDKTGQLFGMVQQDIPNPLITIDLDKSIHIKFGDMNNPEGLATLEAIWRLERIKYGFEVVMGIGYEHSAGYLDITFDGTLSADDEARVKKAARAILSAQEGNYALWPKGVEGEIKDIAFTAGVSLLSTIRYYSILKLMLFSMQFVAMSTISGSGSFAAADDSSEVAVMYFNAMMEGFVDQFDQQFGARLFEMNPSAFPNMTRRPKAVASKITKDIPLAELGQFAAIMSSVLNMTPEDRLAIRRHSGILPEVVDEEEAEPDPETEPETEDPTDDNLDMARRPFIPAPGENFIKIEPESQITEASINQAVKSFEVWAEVHEPGLAKILRAKRVKEDE